MSKTDNNTGTAEIFLETQEKATTRMGDLRHSAEEAVDRSRMTAADGLAKAAEKLHQTAEHLPGVETASHLAHGAADRIGGAADFLRDHDTRAMVDGVEQFVRKHPGKSLAVAAVVGFLAARALRDD